MGTNERARSIAFDPRRLGASSLPGRRSANEDAWAAPPAGFDVTAGACFVIADGVGGQARGDLASATAATTVFRVYYERRAVGDDPPTALLAAVAEANSAVYQLGRSLNVERMGCTLAAAALTDGRLHVAHVGDARAWLWMGGRLYPLTRDHSWVQEQVDRGLITAEDAAQHELRHVVTRVLGNEATVEATPAAPLSPGAGDALLLTTDGIHDTLTPEQMAGLMSGVAPAAAVEALTAAALKTGSEDNVTALVALVGGDNGLATPPAALPAPLPATVQGQAYRATPRHRSALGPALLGAALFVVALALLGSFLPRLGGDGATATAPATHAPIIAATMTPPATSPDPTAPTAAAGGCIIDPAVYVWTNEQAADQNLNQVAYYVISGPVTTLSGPVEMPAYSKGNILPFYQVRSLLDNAEGWVLAATVECAQ